MRSLVRWRRGAALVLLSVGLGLGGSAVFAGTQASAAGSPASIFNASDLLPGDTLTGHLDLPSSNQPLTPYLQALNLQDGCVAGETCTPNGPKLSQTLPLVVTAPDGSTWRGTAADLLTPVVLPGGLLPANSGSRTYGISLSVPATLTDSSEDRTFAFELQYGGMDGSEQIVTSVLGETFTKGGGTTTSVLGEHTSKGALPFTGSYAGITFIGGLALVSFGTLLLVAGYRRRGQRTN